MGIRARHIPLFLILWAFPGCAEPQDQEPGTGDLPHCPPLTLTLAQEWEGPDLPQRGDTNGSHPGVALGDVDGDGDLDLLMAYGGGSGILENEGAGTLNFSEAFTLDIGEFPPGSSAAFADLDADGDLDAYLGSEFGEVDHLLYNDGQGRFTAMELADSQYDVLSGAFGDLDGDGDLDLVAAGGRSNNDPEAILAGEQTGDPERMYQQEEDGSFVPQPGRIPNEDDGSLTFQVALLDADQDSDLDLYVGNDYGPFVEPNRLLLNDGQGGFQEATGCGCELVMYSMGVAVGDADGNSLPDLYITDIGHPNLLLNVGGGQFVDATLAEEADIPPSATNLSSWGTSFQDFNQDGCLDLVVAFGRLGREGEQVIDILDIEGEGWVDPEEQADVILEGSCGEGFTRLSGLDFDSHLARSRSLAVGDLDGDRQPDLVGIGRDYLRVWRTGGGCGTGVTVKLQGDSGNVDGFGAKVELKAGGRSTTQWMLPGVIGSSSALELYFGLGEEQEAESLRVTWPDGTVTEAKGPRAGERVVVGK